MLFMKSCDAVIREEVAKTMGIYYGTVNAVMLTGIKLHSRPKRGPYKWIRKPEKRAKTGANELLSRREMLPDAGPGLF
jgi:hypothetical protein